MKCSGAVMSALFLLAVAVGLLHNGTLTADINSTAPSALSSTPKSDTSASLQLGNSERTLVHSPQLLEALAKTTTRQRRRVAVTVLVVHGNRASLGEPLHEILDGACVLRHTMDALRESSGIEEGELDFIALVREGDNVSARLLDVLQVCGYRIRRSASVLPTLSSSGKMSSEKKSVVAGRAVGIVELLKLDALLMLEYDVVLSLDADIMFTGSYDDLVAPYHDAPYRLSYDFNGGMVVYYPKNDGPKHYRRLLHHFVHTPWTPSGGYAGTGLGEEIAAIGFSGGPMLQGLLPFYLQYDLRVNPRLPRHGIPPCKHNFYLAAESEQFCNDYRGPIHSVHFKGSNFPKPWECDALEERREKCLDFSFLTTNDELNHGKPIEASRASSSRGGERESVVVRPSDPTETKDRAVHNTSSSGNSNGDTASNSSNLGAAGSSGEGGANRSATKPAVVTGNQTFHLCGFFHAYFLAELDEVLLHLALQSPLQTAPHNRSDRVPGGPAAERVGSSGATPEIREERGCVNGTFFGVFTVWFGVQQAAKPNAGTSTVPAPSSMRAVLAARRALRRTSAEAEPPVAMTYPPQPTVAGVLQGAAALPWNGAASKPRWDVGLPRKHNEAGRPSLHKS